MLIQRTAYVMSALILFANVGYGDLAPTRARKPAPPIVAPVKVVQGEVDEKNKDAVARIVIPKSLLPDMQKKSEEFSAFQEAPPVATIVAGLALTAAAVSAMLMFRKSPKRQLGVAGLIGCVAMGGYALYANAPPVPRKVPAERQADDAKHQSQILIEITNQGHEVILTLPKSKS